MNHAHDTATVDAVLAAFGRQDWPQAARLAQALSRQRPEEAFAWKALGTVLSELGDLSGAHEALVRARDLDPKDAQTQLNLGNVLAQMGQVNDALAAMQCAIDLQPNDMTAHAAKANLLQQLRQHESAKASATQALTLGVDARVHGVMANACLALGELTEAHAHAQAGVELAPQVAGLWVVLGQVRRAQGQLPEALQALLQAMELNSALTSARIEAARVLVALQQAEQACELLEATVHIQPGQVDVYLAWSDALVQAGRAKQAIQALEAAEQRGLQNPALFNALGLIHEARGQWDEASKAYQDALDLDAHFAPAHNNLALVWVKTGRYIDALAHARLAVAHAPTHVEMWSNLGHILQDLGELDESVECYRRALAIAPDHHAVHSNLLFGLNYQSQVSDQAAFDEALAYGRRVANTAAKRPLRRTSKSQRAKPSVLRVGFVSGDIRQHPVGYFGAPVLCALAQQGVEVFVYANHRQQDAITQQVQNAVHCYVWVDHLSDHDAAQRIADDQLDVLVDLAGHTAYNRLPVFAYRPAPVQVAWLGYFATTGVEAMDYIVCDEHVLPVENEQWFTEKPLRVSPSYLCYTPPAEAATIEPPENAGRPFTFGCFNNPSKFNDAVIALWAKILLEAKESRLLLVAKPYRDPAVCAHMRERFRKYGVPDHQLKLMPAVDRGHYFQAHNDVDLMLDPFPYPGGTTSADAWWMGVPVLSLAGPRFVTRNALTLGLNMGASDGWAEDEATYCQRALQTCRAGQRSTAEREQHRSMIEKSAMLDAQAYAASLSRALQRVAASHEQKEPA